MPAETPTILATSGGLFPDPRTVVRPSPLVDYALELARPTGRPRLCLINTAGVTPGSSVAVIGCDASMVEEVVAVGRIGLEADEVHLVGSVYPSLAQRLPLPFLVLLDMEGIGLFAFDLRSLPVCLKAAWLVVGVA